MMLRGMLLVLSAACAGVALAQSPASDLDALMGEVLTRRDGNWKKLQQYILEERETLEVTALDHKRIFGFRREYQWFPRDGFFIKSPLTADGVRIPEDERRRAEARWLAREQSREKFRQSKQPPEQGNEARIGSTGAEVEIEAALRDALEPGFVSAAYFLDFKFEEGQYALVGRDKYNEHDVLQVEYYPTKMFTGGRGRPNRQLRERNKEIGRQMNKVSIVTLWVDPLEKQIVKYDFRNVDADFFPAGWLMRLI